MPPWFPAIPTLLLLPTAVAHIRAEYRGPRRRVYIAKPSAMVCIGVLAVFAPGADPAFLKWGITAGLAFSLVGDVYLMLPRDRFLAGLAAFLVAHIFYVAAFSAGMEIGLPGWTFLPVLVYGLVMLRLLWPHLGRKKVPVAFYVLAILAMVWRAVVRWEVFGGWAAGLLLCGAVLFAVSDSVLAWNRFRRPFAAAQLVTLSTYYAAQWCIAMSLSARS